MYLPAMQAVKVPQKIMARGAGSQKQDFVAVYKNAQLSMPFLANFQSTKICHKQ